MPRIPAYDDIGNKPMSVESADYFGVLAEGYAGFIAVEISLLVPTALIPKIDDKPVAKVAFDILKNPNPAPAEMAKGFRRYLVHTALHRMWVDSFGEKKGDLVRVIMDRTYLLTVAEKQTGSFHRRCLAPGGKSRRRSFYRFINDVRAAHRHFGNRFSARWIENR